MAFLFQQYLNPDGTLKSQNVGQPIASAPSGDTRFGYDAQPIFDKYTSQIDYSAPDALDQLYAKMRADGINVERKTDGAGDLFRIPGTDAGWVDILQNKAAVEGRGPVRGWAYQPFYGSEDFDRLVSMGLNPHTGEPAPPGAQYSRDSDQPINMGGGMPPGYSTTGANNLASFSAPGINAPFTQQFKAPTGTDDPGFQFALQQGQKALERSAAAKGTLLTGGHMADLMEHGVGMGLQGYDQAWNRAFDLYGMNRDTFWGNQNNAYNRLSGAANLGAGAASSYGNNATNLAIGRGNTNAAATVAGANATGQAVNTIGAFGPSVWDQISQRFGGRGGLNPMQGAAPSPADRLY